MSDHPASEISRKTILGRLQGFGSIVFTCQRCRSPGGSLVDERKEVVPGFACVAGVIKYPLRFAKDHAPCRCDQAGGEVSVRVNSWSLHGFGKDRGQRTAAPSIALAVPAQVNAMAGNQAIMPTVGM